MAARITRILLMLQLLAALAIGLGLQRLTRGDPSMPPWLALACGLPVVLCIRALIAANNFRLAARFAGTGTMPAIGLRRGAGLYLRELRATLVSSSWDMPFRRLAAMTLYPERTIPVLLIHGFGCNSGYWRPLHRRLCAARISHHGIDLEPILADIDSYAPQVEAAIDALCAATGQGRVIIVGHSMGGLAARAWIRAHGHSRLARLITLGTPHHGTALAHYAPGENSHQMCHAANIVEQACTPQGAPKCSDWLTVLNAAQQDARLPLVSIYSHHDNIVAPADSCVVVGALNIAFPGVGHVRLGSDPAILACILDQIRQTAAPGKPPHAAGMPATGVDLAAQAPISIQENPSS